jgi:hypothetical protein
MQGSIVLVWIGALLFVAGIVFTAVQALWRGRLSEPRQARPGAAGTTLEPRGSNTGGFGLKANWPGLALIAVGAILLLVGGVM